MSDVRPVTALPVVDLRARAARLRAHPDVAAAHGYSSSRVVWAERGD
ncbi:hypothetical protein H7H82_02185 [Mycobacterium heidelbergense]|nr:hypothetical protein [Mycobacterium heidelbergense]MCV7049429.1 hypothetical protein [Mycobacterium heidelbergense]